MSSVVQSRTVIQQFQVDAEGNTGSLPSVLRDDTLEPTVQELKVLEINLANNLTDEVIDLTSIPNPLGFYFSCDQDITVKIGDGTDELTFTDMRSGALNFGTAAAQTITMRVTTPAEYPTPIGETTAPTSATLYIELSGNQT